MGLMSVVGTLVAMVIPLCLFWCQAVKRNTQKSYQLKAHEGMWGEGGVYKVPWMREVLGVWEIPRV